MPETSPHTLISKTYLPHIDGLRGVSVLIVLFFHLDIQLVSGGFIGVDIFFVISGYLITSIILEKIETNNFKLGSFYMKRVKRLLPVMLFTLLVTVLVGLYILPRYKSEQLSISAISALFSFSNIFFWRESGYFDSSSEFKPLLHTWSLAVEEQFYLFWPSFLFLLSKLKNEKIILYTIILIATVSLFTSQFLLVSHPSAVFFLTPFRIIEFSIGALLFWLTKRPLINHYLNELLSIVSMFGILTISILFHNNTTFPGINSLLPCFFAAILIYSGNRSKTLFFLKSTPLVFLGKISYSLYLCHWPIIVYYKIVKSPTLTPPEQIYLFVISIACAILMYYTIEKPLRGQNTHLNTNKISIVFIICLSLATLSISSIVYLNEGNLLKHSTSKELSYKEINDGKSKRFKILNELREQRGDKNYYSPVEGKTNVLILGDSHAPDALNFLYTAYPAYHFVCESIGGCPPMVEQDFSLMSYNHPEKEKCIELNLRLLSKETLKHYDFIVINVLFGWYNPTHLLNTITQIRKCTTSEIIVFGNYIYFNDELPNILHKYESPTITPEMTKNMALYEDELEQSSIENNFIFISKKEILCKGNSDCNIFIDEYPITYDEHHLSLEASLFIAKKLKERNDIFKK